MNAKLNLESLKIQNYATFENQTISFHNNFNSIVGETGSGKSLILDALQLVFGARADKRFVRKNSEFSTIEAVFSIDSDSVKSYFDNIGFPIEDKLVIKRIIYSTGKSKSFLNYQKCPLNMLSQVSRRFIDIVGQFENQKLLTEDYQIKLIDNYGGHENLVQNFKNNHERLKELQSKLISLKEIKLQSTQKREYILFQLEELSKLSPSLEDEIELKSKKNQIINHQENQKSLAEIDHILSESDRSILSQVNTIKRLIDNISSNESLHEDIESLSNIIEEFSYKVSKLSSSDELEENLDDIIDRLDFYQKLKRKFSTDTDGLISLSSSFNKELKEIEDVDENISNLEKQIFEISEELYQAANKLHVKRENVSKALSKELTESIQSLNMNGATINLKVSKLDSFNKHGLTKLDFLAETNPGEGLHPIKEIASGGELSRILLSLRKVLSQTSSISVFLFDEIDTGVGGDTAIKIGNTLKNVSSNGQVIAITHLPQIANLSDRLIVVEKESLVKDSNVRTHSSVIIFNSDNKEEYINQMQAL